MRNITFLSYLILESKVFTRACAGIHLVFIIYQEYLNPKLVLNDNIKNLYHKPN